MQHVTYMCRGRLWLDAQSGLDPNLLRNEENRAALPACSSSIHSGTGASPDPWFRYYAVHSALDHQTAAC